MEQKNLENQTNPEQALLERMEQLFPDMDNSEIKQELFTIKRTAQEISKKMDRELRHYEAQRQSEAR